jgi:SAM-dependent methyltransferase
LRRITGRSAAGIGSVRFGDLRRTTPISRSFGYDRGLPIDRHYIEAFLEEWRNDVRGRVLEIGDDTYTRRFGSGRVTEHDVLHVDTTAPGATFTGDLADGAMLPDASFDCVILTQTLHLVYDFGAALRTVERILVPGGVLLLTVPGITNVDPGEWGATWFYSFTAVAVRRMCSDHLPGSEVTLQSYGNVLAAIAFLHGLSAGELDRAELDVHEAEYSIVHCARVVRDAAV